LTPEEAIAEEAALEEFFDRLEAGIFRMDAKPADRQFFRGVRALSEHRFKHLGADQYGRAYLDRDNIREANDEGADFMNYLYMEDQKTFQRTGEHIAIDVLLSGAKLMFEGMDMIAGYPAKLRGSP
jgi:hypothetical protein